MAHVKHDPPLEQSAQALTAFLDAMKVPERYFQMLLALHGLQNETFPYGWLTWVDWGRTDPTGRALLLYSYKAVSQMLTPLPDSGSMVKAIRLHIMRMGTM